MNTLRTITVAVLLLTVGVGSAQAGIIGIFFDEERTSTVAAYDPFETFNMYIIIYDLNDRMNAVEYKLNLPQQVAITGTAFGGDNPLPLFDNPQDGTVVGLGSCEFVFDGTPQEEFMVANISAVAVTTFDAEILTLTKFTGGGDGNPAAVGPRYSICDGGGAVELTASMAQLTGGVATVTSSFGAVKALYE